MFKVQQHQCKTCIYRPESPLDLEKLEGDIADFYGGFQWLTRPMYNLLCKIRDCHEYDHEVIFEKGAGWYVGATKVRSRIVYELLGLCLLHDESDNNEEFKRFTLNSDGRRVIQDVNYTPSIIIAQHEQLEREKHERKPVRNLRKRKPKGKVEL